MTTEEHVMGLFEQANPVAGRSDAPPSVGASSYLATIEQRSNAMTLRSSDVESAPETRSRRWVMAAAAVSAIVLVGGLFAIGTRGGDDPVPADQPAPTGSVAPTSEPATAPTTAAAAVMPVAGPVTIETVIVPGVVQTTGTFEVVEGADLLGCSAGSLTQSDGPSGNTGVMTCEDGDREGTFSLRWRGLNSAEGPGDENGPWSVVASSGDFTGLNGEGLWSGTNDNEIGSFAGTIEFGTETKAPEPVVDDTPAWEQGINASVPAGTVRLPVSGGVQFELDAQREIVQLQNEYAVVVIAPAARGEAQAEVKLLAPAATSSGQPLTTIDELTAALTADFGATLVPIDGEIDTAIGVAQGLEYTINDDAPDSDIANLQVGETIWLPANGSGQLWLIDTERGLFMVTAEGLSGTSQERLDEAIVVSQRVLGTIEFIDLTVE